MGVNPLFRITRVPPFFTLALYGITRWGSAHSWHDACRGPGSLFHRCGRWYSLRDTSGPLYLSSRLCSEKSGTGEFSSRNRQAIRDTMRFLSLVGPGILIRFLRRRARSLSVTFVPLSLCFCTHPCTESRITKRLIFKRPQSEIFQKRHGGGGGRSFYFFLPHVTPGYPL